MFFLTVDTNIIVDYIDESQTDHALARQLIELHQQHLCDIRFTTRVDFDLPADAIRERAADLDLVRLPRIGTIVRLNFTGLTSGDFLADEKTARDADLLLELLFPGADPNSPKHRNRLSDIDHLLGHRCSDRDVFVTRDGGILGRAVQLEREFEIVVRDLAGCVQALGE